MSRPTPVPSPSAPAPARAGGSADMSVVSRGLTIEGNLSGDDDIRVDGRVNGDITSRSVIVSQGATVNGSVHAESIEVLGNVTGEISGKTVRISGTGRLDGDVSYDSLSIESGAVVNGKLRHGAAKAPASARSGNGAAKPSGGKSDDKAETKDGAKAAEA
ncbi:MAG: polymer-forming cytoskeletal protein [Alphaproteobacteria bacterium]